MIQIQIIVNHSGDKARGASSLYYLDLLTSLKKVSVVVVLVRSFRSFLKKVR